MNCRFYGYKHWTCENVPRCFYVGKGLKTRPYSKCRSKKWYDVVERYGLFIEVCVGPLHDHSVIQWEKQNIAMMKTYSTNYHIINDDICCNFTFGGDGVAGKRVSRSTRQKISNSHKGKILSDETRKKIRNQLKGRKLSDETRKKMSNSRKGKSLSTQNKQNLWKNRSRIFSDEHRNNLSIAAKNRRRKAK